MSTWSPMLSGRPAIGALISAYNYFGVPYNYSIMGPKTLFELLRPLYFLRSQGEIASHLTSGQPPVYSPAASSSTSPVKKSKDKPAKASKAGRGGGGVLLKEP